MKKRTRVKICCIKNFSEAQLAIDFGADALGLVGEMPSGPGIIEDSVIKEIVTFIPPPLASFLLSSETTATNILIHHQKTQTNTIQLVDELELSHYPSLRKIMPNVKFVQVVHVIDDSSISYALKVAAHVDAIILDSGNPKAKIKELGGTGRVHNWKISRQIVAELDIPVFLAGGLNPKNVAEAIKTVRPFGVDVCSGIRTNGNLDERKLEAFMEAVAEVNVFV